jgi:hypothetical protein
MADEKILKIVAKVEGNQGPSPDSQEKAYNEAAIKARIASAKAEEARLKSLLSPFSVDTMGNEGTESVGTARRGRGRPRKGPWDPNGKVPPPAPKGKAGAPPLPEDDVTTEEGKSKLSEAWKIFRKGITAFSGANGKLTKSVAFASRGFEFAAQTVSSFKEAGVTATGALQGVRTVAAGAAGKFGLSAAAAAKVATAAGAASVALGVVAIGTAAFTIALGASVGALKLLTHVTENLQEVVGKFSASLEAARAQSKVAEIQTRMRSAQRVGGELASLESSRSAATNAIIETKTELVDLFSPFLKATMDFFTNILKILNTVLAILNIISEGIEAAVEAMLETASTIPLLGYFAKGALRWMQQDEVNNIKAASGLHEQIGELFQEDNLGLNRKKNKVAAKFLP